VVPHYCGLGVPRGRDLVAGPCRGLNAARGKTKGGGSNSNNMVE
jgi:hypothetical protein